MRPWVAALIAASVVCGGCATSTPQAAPSVEPDPPYVGRIGVPVHAHASNGATADITLNAVAWLEHRCPGGNGTERDSCGVLDLTFTNTSAQPFKYDDTAITGSYGGGTAPWTHPDDELIMGASPLINYNAINKLPPLRSGEVPPGQTVHGFVGIGFGGGGDWYIKVEEPAAPGHWSGNTQAGWHVHE